MRFDPIIKRDIKVSSRGPAFTALIMALNAVLGLVVLLGVFGRITGMNAVGRIDPGQLLKVYLTAAGVVLVFTVFVLPGRTTGSVTGERDSGTLDLMIAAGLTPAGIIEGKYLSALLFGSVAVFSCFPSLLIPLLYGGVGFSECLILMISFIPTAALVLAIGVFASSDARTSSSAAALGYGIIMALTAGPMLTAFLFRPIVSEGANYAAYSVILCPGIPAAVTALSQTGSREYIDMYFSYLGLVPNASFLSYITVISAAAELIMTVLFLVWAGYNITPRRRYR